MRTYRGSIHKWITWNWVIVIGLLSLSLSKPGFAQKKIEIVRDSKGFKLQVDGQDFFMKGVNWDYIPVGENYRYPFWNKSDDFIKKVLDQEMSLIQAAGMNTIRQYTGVPPRWVDYIYRTYGIYTVINPVVGRYGINVNGTWQANTDYSDPKVRAAILEQTIAEVNMYKDSEGVLIWLLGNENNYGLHWSSFEIENLPKDKQDNERARHLYTLFEEVTQALKKIDRSRPVAIANGDLQYIDIIAKETPSIDMFASNVYRGKSAGDLYQRVQEKLNKPFFYSEFGADAYDAKRQQEDHLTQAQYLHAQWKEIYLNTHGRGVGNVIGGLTFQWSDGWWKHGQEDNLDVHDTVASWANAGYPEDYVEGQNNMNEEWFGIAAKLPKDAEGISRSVPRTAYYVLREIYKVSPYDPRQTEASLAQYIDSIDPLHHTHHYASRLLTQQQGSGIHVRSLRLRLESIYADGDNTSRAERPGWKKFDHLESIFVGLRGQHGSRVQADLNLNILGNVPQNRIDEIFYENRLRSFTVQDEDSQARTITSGQHITVHNASFQWDEDHFHLEGFYRSGHGHWGYEGDLFNFFPESYNMYSIDLYNAMAPIGMVLSGKQNWDSWKLALGPELFWGANPSAIVKYHKDYGRWEWSALYQRDLGQKTPDSAGGVVPELQTQKASLAFGWKPNNWNIQAGILNSGREQIGRNYTRAESVEAGTGYRGSDYRIIDDVEIKEADTMGGKLRLTYTGGPVNFYSQLIHKGLVANSGGDPLQNLTGWVLRESGSGNQQAFFAGASYWMGPFQISPHMMLRRPLEGPLPDDPLIKDDQILGDGSFSQGVRLRNMMEDPFAVIDNREVNAYELLLLFDPTPATDFWRWDQEVIEDAPFAASLNLVYRDYRSTRDSHIGFTALGVPFAFNAAPPVKDLWDIHTRMIMNMGNERKFVISGFAGNAQANSGDERLVMRHGFGLRSYIGRTMIDSYFRFHDFGPYDYHRDYNLTFPFQGTLQAAYGLRSMLSHTLVTNFGMKVDYRTLDQHSPRYPYADEPHKRGDELQITTFVDINM